MLICHTLAGIPRIENKLGVKRFAMRGLLAATEEDIVVLDYVPPSELLEYYVRIGLSEPVVLVPENTLAFPDVITAILSDHGTLAWLKSRGQMRRADFYVPSWQADVLSKELSLAPTYGSCVAAMMANNRLFLDKLHVEATRPPHLNVPSLESLPAAIQDFWGGDRVLVKEAVSAGGEGIFLFADGGQFLEWYQKQTTDVGYAVEGFVDHSHAINVQFYIDDIHIQPRGVSLQLFSDSHGLKHAGNIGPVRLGSHASLELTRQLQPGLQSMQRMGIRGWLGYDFLVVTSDNESQTLQSLLESNLDGDLVLVEVNCRWNASTYSFVLSERLGLTGGLWLSVSGFVDNMSSFGEFVSSPHSRFLWDPRAGLGAVPLAISPYANGLIIPWMIVAPTWQQLAALYDDMQRRGLAHRIALG